MAVWDEGVQLHPAFKALVEAEAILDGTPLPADQGQLAVLSRARAAVSAIRAALAAADPQLIPEALLSEISDGASQLRDSSRSFQQSGDPTHLGPIQTQVELLLGEMTLGAFARPEVVDALRDSLIRYRKSAGQLVRNLEAEVRSTSGKAQAAADALASLDARITQAADAAGTEVVGKLAPVEARVSALSDKIVAEGTKVEALVATKTKEFEVAKAEWERQNAAFLDEQRALAAEAIAEMNRQAAAQIQLLESEAQTTLADLRSHLEDAKKLVSAIGAIGITGGFGEYAHQQKRRADFWSGITVVALLLAALPGAVYLLRVTIGDQAPVDLERFVERILVGGPLYVLAGYAALQSARSRDNERRARAKELELGAIGPYLARLEEGDRNRMIIELAPRYFGLSPAETLDRTGIPLAEALRRIEESSPKG